MTSLTKNIGKSQVDTMPLNGDITIKKVLVVRPNHRLGNLILTTPLIQEIETAFPECEIDILAKGNLAPIVFGTYGNIKNYLLLPRKPFKHLINYALVWLKVKFRTYDLVVNAVRGSSSGRLLTQIANSKYKIFGAVEAQKVDASHKGYHMAKNPIHHFRTYFSKSGIIKIDKPIAPLDLKLTKDEIEKGKTILKSTFDNNKITICIFTYATGSKCYSKLWWKDFYTQLKLRFKDYNILEILPVENISQIDFQAESFYSKDIREIGSVIANAELFIGADSGIMHLASSTKTTTIGLFSNTKIEKYKPYANGSFAINTQKNNVEECISLVENAFVYA
ncbi:glycosyltransferase family 9 protein [Psychroserpens sp. XS_ASV72]|uniref:glycosyltransferase family 9 protein n=1 Tax=Psychroserpens sp. XS_ASV72 TaxID=3241293 RepID=UPI0035157FF6